MAHFDEKGFLIYDGGLPPDVDWFNTDVRAEAAIATIYFVWMYGGVILKLALVAYSLYSYYSQTAPPLGSSRSSKRLQGFGFDITNTTSPDEPLAIVCGDHIVAPHLFYQKISNKGNNNRLDIGWGIGEGPITAVSGVKVSNIEFDTLTGENSYDVHYGVSASGEQDTRLSKLTISTDYNDQIPPKTDGNPGELIRNGVATNATGLDVGILFPEGLFSIDAVDGVGGASVTLEYFYRLDGASDWIPTDHLETFTNPDGSVENVVKSKKAYTKTHQGELRITETLSRNLPAGRYDIRILNHSSDPQNFSGSKQVNLDFINEFVPEQFAVPYFAYLGMNLEATDTLKGAQPTTTAIVRGIKVKVYTSPSVYTEEWSDNPVWHIRNILTHPRYGLGYLYTDGDIDVASFIAAAEHCDEIDANGARRGQLDLVINEVLPAVDVLATMLNTFGGIPKFSSEKIGLAVFKDEPAGQTFDESNIKKGTLEIEQADPKDSTNINRVNLAFLNRDKNFVRDVIRVQVDSEITSEAAVVEKNVDMFGITRALAVEAQGRKLLNTYRAIIVNASWESDISTIESEVGDVIYLTHSMAGWVNKKFRILSMEEAQDSSRKIRAVEHVPAVYDTSTTGLLPTVETNLLNPTSTASPIEGLEAFRESVILGDGTVRLDLGVYWTVPSGLADYYSIDHFEVFGNSQRGIELPSGTLYNENDFGSVFYSTQSGTTISGVRPSAADYNHLGNVRPPTTNFHVNNINPLDFWYVKVLAVTNSLIAPSLQTAPTAVTFIATYSGAPDNTASFSVQPVGDAALFTWSPVQPISAPDLKGYEIRDALDNFGVDNSALIFRGNTTSYSLPDIDFRTKTFYFKSFNHSGVYSTTVKSATYTNLAPTAVTQTDPVVSGPTIIIQWAPSSDTDVVAYRINASTSAGFTPSDSNAIAEVGPRELSSYRFQPARNGSGSYDTWYIKIAAMDSLTYTLDDFNYSNEKSATPQSASDEVSVESAGFNVIRDGSFRGLSQWSTVSGSSVSADQGHLIGTNSSLRQFLVSPSSSIQTGGPYFLSIEASAAVTPTADLRMRVTNSGVYNLQMTVPAASIVATGTRFTQEITFSGSIPDSLSVELISNSTNQIDVDHAMLAPGNPTNQFISSPFDVLRGVSDALTGLELSSDIVAARHLQANSVTAPKIVANSITSDKYFQLRNTLTFTYQNELDADYPLILDWQVPAELTTAFGAQGIVQVLLSYKVRPFRATAKADTSVVSSSVGGTTAGIAQTTHTHRMESIFNNATANKPQLGWINGAFGLMGNNPPAGVLVSTTSDGTPNHSHLVSLPKISSTFDYTVSLVAANAPVSSWVARDVTGQIPNFSTEASLGHSHTFVFVSVAKGTLGGYLRYNADTNTITHGNSSQGLPADPTGLTSEPGPNAHDHDFTVPDHTHGIDYGINEISAGPDISVYRSNDGTTFEGSPYDTITDPAVVQLDLDLDPSGTFFTGTGFKALKFTSTEKTRITATITLKADIDS